MTRLRISNCRLQIETDRYKQPKVARNDRICMLCNIALEDEFHFLCTCVGLANLRQEIFGEGGCSGNKLEVLNHLLNNEDPQVCRTTAKYINVAMAHRANLLMG